MVAMQRQRVLWSGFIGAPGISTFYFTDAAASQGSLSTFFAALATVLPAGASVQVETAGDTIESTTGALSGSWVGSAQPASVGTVNSGHAAPVGFQYQWLTSSIVNGHRVRGRTFIVPVNRELFDTDGTLVDASRVTLTGAAANFLIDAGANFLIWSRPHAPTPSWTDVHGKVHPARPLVVGAASPVTGVRVPDKAIVLRSRRD